MKKKAIFLSNQPERIIPGIYTFETIKALGEILDIDKIPVSKSQLVEKNGKYKGTKIIFSTWGMPYLSSEEIKEYLPDIEAVFYGAGTVQYFAKPFFENNVRIFSAWAANAIPVAQFAVSLILLANKGFFQTTRRMRDENRADLSRFCGSFPGNYKTPVGITGAGMIGKLVIKDLVRQGLKVKVYDPYLSIENANSLGVIQVDIEELFATCQTISNHMPDNDSTRGTLNYRLFSKMSGNGNFINTGRGAQVVEEDLILALNEYPDRTAILDVTHPEPAPAGHPFYKIENVFLTPHIAGSTGFEVARMGEYMAAECKKYLNGEFCSYEITADKLHFMA